MLYTTPTLSPKEREKRDRGEPCCEPSADELNKLISQVGPSCSRATISASVLAAAPEPGVDLDSTRSDLDVNDPGTWIPNNLLKVINNVIIDFII